MPFSGIPQSRRLLPLHNESLIGSGGGQTRWLVYGKSAQSGSRAVLKSDEVTELPVLLRFDIMS